MPSLISIYNTYVCQLSLYRPKIYILPQVPSQDALHSCFDQFSQFSGIISWGLNTGHWILLHQIRIFYSFYLTLGSINANGHASSRHFSFLSSFTNSALWTSVAGIPSSKAISFCTAWLSKMMNPRREKTGKPVPLQTILDSSPPQV